MGKAEKTVKKILIVIECVILAIGVLLSYFGTSDAVKYSKAYTPYYLYAVLGVACIVVLLLLRDKQLTVHLGFVMIVVYALFAGFHGYGNCEIAVDRFQKLQQYKGATFSLYIDDEVYEWKGATLYNGKELQPLSLEGREAYTEMKGNKNTPNPVYVKQDQSETLYYVIDTRDEGDYLIMVKVR